MSSDRKAAKDKKTAQQLLLVAEVRAQPILYDQSREDYKDQDRKKDAWKKVAQKVGLNDDIKEVKRRWKNMRTVFNRVKKNVQGTSGMAAEETNVSWAPFKDMRASITSLEVEDSDDEACDRSKDKEKEDSKTDADRKDTQLLATPKQEKPQKRPRQSPGTSTVEQAFLRELEKLNKDYPSGLQSFLELLGDKMKSLEEDAREDLQLEILQLVRSRTRTPAPPPRTASLPGFTYIDYEQNGDHHQAESQFFLEPPSQPPNGHVHNYVGLSLMHGGGGHASSSSSGSYYGA